MTDIALPGSIEPAQERGPKLDHATNPLQLILFFGALASLGFGIVGQYLWLSLQIGRRRPNYIVRSAKQHGPK